MHNPDLVYGLLLACVAYLGAISLIIQSNVKTQRHLLKLVWSSFQKRTKRVYSLYCYNETANSSTRAAKIIVQLVEISNAARPVIAARTWNESRLRATRYHLGYSGMGLLDEIEGLLLNDIERTSVSMVQINSPHGEQAQDVPAPEKQGRDLWAKTD